MPLAKPPVCDFPGCRDVGLDSHHVVYRSNDVRGDSWGSHYYCRKSTKGNKSERHEAEIVVLCRKHHMAITDYNHRMWVVNRYEALSCHQRKHYWKLFLEGKSPPGVDIEGYTQADY